MTRDRFAVIHDPSTRHAVRAEKVLARAGSPCRMVPVPRHLSSDCGVCVRVARGTRPHAREVLRNAGIAIEGVHEV